MTLRHYGREGAPRVVHADEVTFNRESAEIVAQDITADVPPSGNLGRGGAHLTAESGKGDIHGRRAEAFGPVRVTTGAGDRGHTVGSSWDADQGVIRGERPLHAQGPGYSVDAEDYRFHVADQKLELTGGVHVVSHERGVSAPAGKAP